MRESVEEVMEDGMGQWVRKEEKGNKRVKDKMKE